MRKESRRKFIKTKLLRGITLSIAGSIPSAVLSYGSNDKKPLEIFELDGATINWAKVKSQFTLKTYRRHFNVASISPSPINVQEKIIEKSKFVNEFGLEQHNEVESVRKKLGVFLNSQPDQIAITRNTTEGMNILAQSLNLNKGDEVILTEEEHVGGAAPWLHLQNSVGIKIVVVSLANAKKNICHQLKKSITKKTKIVAVSHITSLTGTVLPIKDIIDLCRANNVLSIIDGAQAVGQIPIDLKALDPDFYVSSGHKWLFGPNGTGILYLNKNYLKNTAPLFNGAYTDSKFNLASRELEYVKTSSRYEYGTINSPIVAGLGAAVDFIQEIGTVHVAQRGRELSLRFRKGLSKCEKIVILTPRGKRESASIVTFQVKDKNGTSICRKLIKNGITVLRAINENNLNAIRASFAVFNSEEEVDELVARIIEIADSTP